MQTKRQVNEVLRSCKGGAHQKDKQYKVQKEQRREYKQDLESCLTKMN